MTPQILLFTGPPSSSSVVESCCTITEFELPFLHLFDLPQPPTTSPSTSSTAPPFLAAWRSLALIRQPLHTGLTQCHAASLSTFSNGAFFTTADVTGLDGDVSRDTAATASQDLLTQFCEYSIMHTMPVPLDSQSLLDVTADSFTTSILSDDGAPIAHPRHLSDLEDVPSAKKVTALQPQTISLNLIVGVLSVAQPRTVTTRWGTSLSLVEVLVGDDTAAGFAVTFWVPQAEVAKSPVVALRRQDVVLLENVALHVFRNKVYGQSLRRGLTKLHLLWRADGSGYYSSRSLRARGENPQREKTRIVKDWVIRFVGLDPQTRTSTSIRAGVSWDRPPDDSQ
ncbi:uncharacterized protein CPUR_01982 [Claviceps purpurea 20.1]|uniref:Uncharacterized protein n=1 Tax=Claviceps purpurea (strain 20.1) TaxID=1111077 RepID=M1WH06_CLAP2|nr:uncharacterized protein CPUR_01982 [Claviceps purpurea 20.1]